MLKQRSFRYYRSRQYQQLPRSFLPVRQMKFHLKFSSLEGNCNCRKDNDQVAVDMSIQEQHETDIQILQCILHFYKLYKNQHLPEVYIFKLNVSTFQNKRLCVIYIPDVRFFLSSKRVPNYQFNMPTVHILNSMHLNITSTLITSSYTSNNWNIDFMSIRL